MRLLPFLFFISLEVPAEQLGKSKGKEHPSKSRCVTETNLRTVLVPIDPVLFKVIYRFRSVLAYDSIHRNRKSIFPFN